MKKSCKLISLLLAVIMAVGMFSGCKAKEDSGKTDDQKGDSTKSAYQQEIDKGALNLVIYMIGEGPTDQNKAVEEINKKMKEEINTTIEVKNTPWADWNTKYQLLFNSGEEFDGCFATSWADFSGLAKKGGFYPITDEMLTTYMPNFSPQLLDDAHKYLWENSAIGGEKFIIPQIYDWKNSYVAIIRGDLRKKYNIDEIKNFDDLLNYALAIGENEPGIIPFNIMSTEDKFPNAFFGSMSWMGMGTGMVYDMVADDGKIINMFETPELLEFYKKARKLQEAGAISKSVLSSQTDSQTNFKAGTSAINIDGLGGPLGVYAEVIRNNPEFEPEIYDFAAGTPKQASSPFDGGMSVYAGTKNPNRTLMAFDLLMGSREYNDLLGLGIKGTHWNPVGEDKYELLDAGVSNYTPYASCPWGLNTNYMRVDESTPEIAAQLRSKWASEIKQLKVDGFVFNDEKVKNEAATVSALYMAEWAALSFGLRPDPEAALADFNKQLKDAGFDKILVEMQAQLDAYIASK